MKMLGQNKMTPTAGKNSVKITYQADTNTLKIRFRDARATVMGVLMYDVLDPMTNSLIGIHSRNWCQDGLLPQEIQYKCKTTLNGYNHKTIQAKNGMMLN